MQKEYADEMENDANHMGSEGRVAVLYWQTKKAGHLALETFSNRGLRITVTTLEADDPSRKPDQQGLYVSSFSA